MTPLRRRMLEDMRIRNLSTGTQQSYIHYIAGFPKHYKSSPDKLGLDDVRNYRLHVLDDCQLASQTVNGFVAAAKFLYTQTLEMPWGLGRLPKSQIADETASGVNGGGSGTPRNFARWDGERVVRPKFGPGMAQGMFEDFRGADFGGTQAGIWNRHWDQGKWEAKRDKRG